MTKPKMPLGFQHTATRRRLLYAVFFVVSNIMVSTHSHAEAAASNSLPRTEYTGVSTHSHAEAAASSVLIGSGFSSVSTHSHAEAAANGYPLRSTFLIRFNTQPRGGGCGSSPLVCDYIEVSTHSHAEAAAGGSMRSSDLIKVSTHSHAEAAARLHPIRPRCPMGINTQPRGGGCFYSK